MRRYGLWLGGTASAALLGLLCLGLFSLRPTNSDDVNMLWAASDMAKGNWRLHGWILSPDNFWGLELPLAAAIQNLTGNALLTLCLVPAIAWLMLGGAAIFAAATGSGLRNGAVVIFLTPVLLIPLHAKNSADFFAGAPYHVLTVAAIMISLALAEFLMKAGRHRKLSFIAFGLVVCDASASDPTFLFLGVVPILAALAVADLPPEASRLRLAGVTIGAAAVGRMVIALNDATGGFTAAPTNLFFTDLFSIPRSLGIIVKSALDVLNCDPFGLSLGQAKIQLIRIPLLAMLCLAVWRTGRQLAASLRASSKTSRAPSFVDTALCVLVVANIGLLVLSNQAVDMGSARLILPAWVAAAVLAARRLELGFGTLAYCALTATLAIGADIQVLVRQPADHFTPSTRQLAACLTALDLKQGYASYWNASAPMLATGNSVTIRAARTDGTLKPFLWLANTVWFHPFPASSDFFVVTAANDPDISPAAVRATFGLPAASVAIGEFLIEIYGHAPPRKTCPSAKG
jgi:hypothetical protein